MDDFVQDFLDSLEQDKSQPRQGNGDYLLRLQMDAPDNQGTIVFAPFPFEFNKKFYALVTGVREFNTKCSLCKKGKTATWIKLLPKEYYGKMSEEDSQLYDELVGLWEEVNKKYKDKKDPYKKIRLRRYSLFQGIILNHTNRENKNMNTVGKAALIIMPSQVPIDSLANATQAMITQNKGSKDWVPMIFSSKPTEREGAVSISFEKSKKNFGYDSTVAFGVNSTFSKVITDEDIKEEEVKKLIADPIREMLTWQTDKESLMNRTVFNELKAALKAELLGDKKPAKEETPKNENGKDPMVDAKPADTPKDEAPKSDAPKEEIEDGMPF